MNAKRILVIVVAALACLLIVGGVGLAASSGPPGLAAAEGLSPGGGYRLTSLSCDVDGTVSGPGYRLAGTVDGTGTPCCCVYLPCTLRDSH
ncbi:MAG: hypothetical protein JW900_07680 [Anaerolineae bacterium]|nr:hypothetical protein [Anaerolineae bacterium]